MPNLRLKNVADTIFSLLSNTATVARQWILPDKDGTIAMTDDIVQLGETSATAYRGDRGKTAYDHSQIVSGNPHGVTAALVGFIFKETPTGLINGSNTIFTLTQPPIAGSEHIFLNGLLQEVASDYTLSTNTITYLIAPETGDKLKVTYCHA